MSIIEATTGHSLRKEKQIAKSLYISIVAAVLVGMAIAFFIGQNKFIKPDRADSLNPVAPEAQQLSQ